MRVVLDSNVLIAAFATHGLCHLIVENCLVNHLVLVSDHVLREVRQKLAHKLKLPATLVRKIDQHLRLHAAHHNPTPTHEPISRDPDDDAILLLAAGTAADYVVTGDQDLLTLDVYEGIPIVTPRRFADILRREPNA